MDVSGSIIHQLVNVPDRYALYLLLEITQQRQIQMDTIKRVGWPCVLNAVLLLPAVHVELQKEQLINLYNSIMTQNVCGRLLLIKYSPQHQVNRDTIIQAHRILM